MRLDEVKNVERRWYGGSRVTKVGRRSAFKLRKFKGALGWFGKLKSLTASKIMFGSTTFPSTLLSMVFRQR